MGKMFYLPSHPTLINCFNYGNATSTRDCHLPAETLLITARESRRGSFAGSWEGGSEWRGG